MKFTRFSKLLILEDKNKPNNLDYKYKKVDLPKKGTEDEQQNLHSSNNMFL